PGTTVDRQCGSSQQAVSFAAAGLIAGQYDIVVAGGVESMSRVPMGSATNGKSPMGESYRARYGTNLPSQGDGAEMIAERWGFSRQQLDEFSLESHAKAARAQDEGRFAAQLVSVTNPHGVKIEADEGIRRGGTVETMAGIRSAFKDGGKITAGNSSQIS